MDALRLLIIDPRVRRHLDTSLTAGPILCGSQQLGAHALTPVAGGDVPSLDETHRFCNIAAIGMGAQTCLEEANHGLVVRLRYQDDQRHWRGSLTVENCRKFPAMLLGGSVRPQGIPENR